MRENTFIDRFLKPKKHFILLLDRLNFALSVFFLLIIIYEIGFELNIAKYTFFKGLYLLYTSIFLVTTLLKISIFVVKKEYQKVRSFEIGLIIIGFVLLLFNAFNFSDNWVIELIRETTAIRFYIVLIFFANLSKSLLKIQTSFLNPSILFVGSFLILILLGTLLLMLPTATKQPLSVINALFTSTSAVCVTGLIVVDTATYFTSFGKHIILFLIQMGGLGIMTFSTFIGFVFTGATDIRNTLYLQEYILEERLGKIFSTIGKIYLFTLVIELIGAILIWFSIRDIKTFNSIQAIDFSIFHSISAFCNAGFSTLTNGLYEDIVRDNYNLHWILSALIIIGGLGFPVIFNLFNTFFHYFVNKYKHYFKNEMYLHQSRHLTVHSKLVLITTAILLISGFFAFYFFEFNNTLKGLTGWGKVTTAFFGSVTPRTAGFNTFDLEKLSMATVLIYLLFMWIGASPASTGGGLKTTTFAVAILNTISIAKNKERIEVFRREISNESVRRALAVFVLSFLIIGIAVFCIIQFNPELTVIQVAFECFSAFSTVGLTIGVTPVLTFESKIVIIVLMFLGRVGTLTILMGIIIRAKTQNYHYPTENVHIT